jgi:hypothetical protein
MQKNGELRSQGGVSGITKDKKSNLAQGELALTLADVGIEYWEAKRWKELAGIETEEFDQRDGIANSDSV